MLPEISNDKGYTPPYSHQYFPQWTNVWNSPPSGSLLGNFIYSNWVNFYEPLQKDIDDYKGLSYYSTFKQYRIAWKAYTSNFQSDTTVINFYSPSVSGVAIRALTPYEFFHAIHPVFFLNPDGTLVFRNLELVETITTPASDYSINLPDVVPDTEVWFKQQNAFQRADTTPQGIYLPQLLTSIVRYSSQTNLNSLDSSGYIQINNNPTIPLIKLDMINCWDDRASIFSLSRYLREDNISLATRIRTEFWAGAKLNKLSLGISNNLLLSGCITWAGSGILNLPSNTTDVVVVGTPMLARAKETPIKLGYNIYRTSKVPVSGSLLVIVSGTTTAVSSGYQNYFSLYIPTEAEIEVEYLYTLYTTVSSSGYITQIIPQNLSPGEYQVYYASFVKAYTLNSPQYKARLYNPDNSATNYLYELGEVIRAKVPITLGHTYWQQAHWFLSDEIKPNMTYISSILE